MKRIFKYTARVVITHLLAFSIGCYLTAIRTHSIKYNFSCVEEIQSRQFKKDIDGWIYKIKEFRKENKNV
ncbi:MAG: hypothetical protein WC465_05040 [Patescibacteria group bacterium]